MYFCSVSSTDDGPHRGVSADAGAPSSVLETEQKYIVYLGGCLGNFIVPAGVPLLEELATTTAGPDPKGVARQRWRAVWALTNLGQNARRFDHLSSERQEIVLAELQDEIHTSERERRDWARAAHTILEGRKTGKLEAPGIAQA